MSYDDDDIPEAEPHPSVEEAYHDPDPEESEQIPRLNFLANLLVNMLILLAAGQADNAQIGRRVRLLLFVVGRHLSGPRTLEELAPMLGLSVPSAWRAEKKLRGEIAQICPEFDDLSSAVRSGVKKSAKGE